MTKQEAVEVIQMYASHTFGEIREALIVAMEAIEIVNRLEKWMEVQEDDLR